MLADIYHPASEAELGFCTAFFSLLKKKISCIVTQLPRQAFHYINTVPLFPKDVWSTKMLLDFQFSGNL